MTKGLAHVTFLGTGSSCPTSRRWLPSILLRLRDSFVLMDCGEGAQYRVLKAGLKVNKLSMILISHFHGDHAYGLPGLLESLGNWGRVGALTIVGPEDLSRLLEVMRPREKLRYEIEFITAKSGLKVRGRGYAVECVAVEHGVDAFGYVILEDPLPGEFNAFKAEELGVPPGLRAKLVRGEPVTLPNGRVVHPDEVVGPSRRGLKIVYSGDTTLCAQLIEAARDADVLIHESTFSADHRREAEASFHSTSDDAARAAQEAGAKLLLLTHFSNRYADDELTRLLVDARRIFRRSYLAKDLLLLEVRRFGVEGLVAQLKVL